MIEARDENGEVLTDFQGWPIEYFTIGDLRKFLEENEDLSDDAKILVLEDDGMGYGAKNAYCTNIEVSVDENDNEELHVWF